jgi:glutathione S-transferase
MPAKLYVVHGSHPCNTVERALQLKGVEYKKVEFPPPAHALVMRRMFGARTVPGLRFDDGEKVQGSRQILERLEERVPEPALLPSEPGRADKVLEAERWGEEVLQPLARRVLWPTLKRNAGAAPSFGEGGQLPLPGFMLKASMPLIARIEMRMNDASDAARADDLRALPGHLDRIDAWIAEGVLGADPPNRADLQIAPSLALLMTMQDLRAVIAPRPAGQLADRLFTVSGSIPAGALPPELVPAAPAAPA